MKIYNFWEKEDFVAEGVTIQFKAGSNISVAHAREIIREKKSLYLRMKSGEVTSPEDIALERAVFSETPAGMEYEVPICEEVCEVLDEHNIVTRNRYGALVLNSEDHLFIDVDTFSTWSWGGFFKSLLGMSREPTKEETLTKIVQVLLRSPLKASGVRIYETCKGFRLLVHCSAFPAYGEEAQKIMREFHADPLYASLCAKQNCYRARLTPKPARMNMKTLLKFRFPYDESLRQAIDDWVKVYHSKSSNYGVCRLVSAIGPEFMDPVIEYHDNLCGCHENNLPLA